MNDLNPIGSWDFRPDGKLMQLPSGWIWDWLDKRGKLDYQCTPLEEAILDWLDAELPKCIKAALSFNPNVMSDEPEVPVAVPETPVMEEGDTAETVVVEPEVVAEEAAPEAQA